MDRVRVWASTAYGGGVAATSNRFVRHRFRPHTHDGLMLGLIEAGSKTFARERESHVAGPGSVSVVNPGEMHTGQRAAGAELRYRALYLAPDLLSLAIGQAEPKPDGARVGFRAGVVDDGPVYAALLRAHEAVIRRAPRLACESLMLEALAALVSRHAAWAMPRRDPAAAPLEIRLVRGLIDERYTGELSIGELARSAGLSPYHLMRQFRRFVGLPIHAYQIQARIEASKPLLGAGRPVVDVALEVGFADQSHFSKRFKDLVGATPAAYQRALRE